MKKTPFLLSLALLLAGTVSGWGQTTRVDSILKTLDDPTDKNVLVAAHRGDWRNFPENSLEGIRSAIDMGADIIEIDLAMTADSVLVLMHDRTVDRTTDGTGTVLSFSLDSLKKLKLKDHRGHPTDCTVPTFEETMRLCKDKAVVNIDKGIQYYDQAHKILEKTGTTRQALIKSGYSAGKIQEILSRHTGEPMMYMPIIDYRFDGADDVLKSYFDAMPVIAYEVVFKEYTPDTKKTFDAIIRNGSRVWVNTMWNVLCGTNDDIGLQAPDTVYGKFLREGATIFQTDRPGFVVEYLRKKGLHR